MKFHLSDTSFMVSKSAVRDLAQIQIIPNNPSIKCTDQDVIPSWVYINTRDPLSATHHLHNHYLFLQIIHENIPLGHHKEQRFVRMKNDFLYNTFTLLEWSLGLGFWEAVNEELLIFLGGGRRNCWEVVASEVKCHMFDDLRHFNNDTLALLIFLHIFFYKLPL